MQVKHIMTRTVLSVAPDTPLFDVVVLLLGATVCAVSVVEDGLLLGIVSEADLMHRDEPGTKRRPAGHRPWWARLFAGKPAHGGVAAQALRARDVMTAVTVSVAEDTPLAEVAAFFESRGIRRAPVLGAGKVVGMIDRADLVRTLAATVQGHCGALPDGQPGRDALLAELASQAWWRPLGSQASVIDGTVHFSAPPAVANEARTARAGLENVSGVRGAGAHRAAAAVSLRGCR